MGFPHPGRSRGCAGRGGGFLNLDAKKEDGKKKKENTTKHIVGCGVFTADVSGLWGLRRA